ncbi:class I SAM-dependent methyltransferase [Paraburkholderia phenazinium]|uniref:Nodulation protein S (NodS) n=1 Tax=Paraburkholderia phenazinium TaxID=60549 RepID=A0A1N6GR49_9BURK|nr:class I SAM-dependent methyltransferase [Paraburkholderia phenazinium]SIO10026.1 Nodulation protein S (NodS) [Paraburkholderia phenazinium]
MISSGCYFDSLYEACDDPWGFRNRWYERRKRLLTMALLPRERYRRVFEPGCANGELSAQLAARCDSLLATDLNETAVRLASERLEALPHVLVERGSVPDDWPAGRFDLIVISELAYYLSSPELERLAECIKAALTPDGTLLACHWRRPFDAAPQSAASVHALFDARCGLTRLARHEDADMLLDVWSRDPRSVAEQEGLA